MIRNINPRQISDTADRGSTHHTVRLGPTIHHILDQKFWYNFHAPSIYEVNNTIIRNKFFI